MRHRLGPLEQTAATMYRRLFFNIDCFVDRLRDAMPDPGRILEIGCGDGDVATRLMQAYPRAEYLGIDPAVTVGRRYRGPSHRAGFLRLDARTLAGGAPGTYDLVIIADVLHHIPEDEDRYETVRAAAQLLSPRGTLVIKEWERDDSSWPYWAGWAADRFISGDRLVRYMRRNDLLDLVGRAVEGRARHERTMWVHPWRCNGLHVYRSTGNVR